MADNDYANAFEHLNFLIQNYPKTPMLGQLRHKTLDGKRRRVLYRLKKLPQALRCLEETDFRTQPQTNTGCRFCNLANIYGIDSGVFSIRASFKVAQQIVARLKNEYGSQSPGSNSVGNQVPTLLPKNTVRKLFNS